MKKFYDVFSNEKVKTMLSQLTWSHYLLLLSLNDYDEIIYYINISKNNNLTQRQLQDKIKNNEYQRIPFESKLKLITNDKTNIKDLVPNPIIIKNINNYETISEKVLQKLILEDIESFMRELDNSFSFIGSEYKIKVDEKYNYIDLLLFNIEYNS